MSNKNYDIKIYIVDDEEYYLNLVKINLNKNGFNDIKMFTTGEECLLEFDNNVPNCIIIDYFIKDGMDGNQILKLIKDKYPETYVLILSGQEDVSVATNIIKNGAYDYIVKDNMTNFNLNNTLQIIKKSLIKEKKENNKKYIYISLITSVWILGLGFLYFLLKNF